MTLTLLKISIDSLKNRLLTAGLTVFAIALSVFLLLGVERVRTEAKQNFTNTISGTDLVIGARSGSIQLLLYSVFRIGNATSNVSWKSYKTVSQLKEVAWSIPISLGDSHRGFRVLGTTVDYFKYYRYGQKKLIKLQAGKPFNDVFHAVLGADVAKTLNYKLGQSIILSHGIGKIIDEDHADKPFTISGILEKTGTPLDRTVHISLRGMEALHIDWRSGAPIPGFKVSPYEAKQLKLQPKSITAFLIGLRSKLHIFKTQRFVNNYRGEPLLAILPGVALQELWDLMNIAEIALSFISILVVGVSLLVMAAMLFSTLNERRREMAILRSVGARISHIFSLLLWESGIITFLGILMGIIMFYLCIFLASPIIESEFGLFLSMSFFSPREIVFFFLIFISGLITGSLPAYRAYKNSLSDGMIVRL